MTRADILGILDGTHGRIGRQVAFAIHVLIVISAVAIAIETLPDLSPAWRRSLLWVEGIILAIFAVEYVLRLVCAQKPLRYATSFWGLVDFVAVVPAIVLLSTDLQSVRALRLLRLARILKLVRISRAIDRIGLAFAQNRTELGILGFMAAVALYLSAVGIYHFEHRVQPDTFGSIPQSLWWAVATLSTVGYGDVVPETAGGRVFTGFVLLIGIGIVAVPAGLVTSALLQQRPLEPGPIESQTKRTELNTEDKK